MKLLYRDEHLAVVDKPSGLLVHRGWGDDERVALTEARDLLGAYLYPVHRLDRGTSGALAFALTEAAASALHRAFEGGGVEKRYLALVRGVAPAEGLVDHPIPRREGGPRVPARTAFRLVGASPVERCSLVEARPETGRLHQVRRHLKHLNHPVLGDANYGKGALNRHYRDAFGLARLALHAASIAFAHPLTGAPLFVEAPVPPDLAGPLAALGLGCFV
ncbi:MAG TPA: pseudouridine synthase [Polyangiaceae bacterium]|nr:pseudouridine synthase [Polyangiaceae bacterium]